MVKRAGGFSLIELLVVVAILGVLLSVGTPAFTEWIASQQVRDTASDIHTSLMRARSEAISSGLSASVVPVGGNWASGWDIANPAHAGSYLERHAAVPNATITGAGTVTFTSVGRLSGAALGIKIQVGGTHMTRCVTVDTAGRAKTKSIAESATCS